MTTVLEDLLQYFFPPRPGCCLSIPRMVFLTEVFFPARGERQKEQHTPTVEWLDMNWNQRMGGHKMPEVGALVE